MYKTPIKSLSAAMPMGKIILALVMSSAMAGAVHAEGETPPVKPLVDQGHGTITFKGDIIDAPCSINPLSQDQTVKLGSIANKQLAGGGKSTPVPVSINLDGCDLGTMKGVKVTFNGTAGDTAAGLDGAFAVTGQAKGVGVVITDLGGTVIKPATTSTVALTQGDNELRFQAYVQGSSVKDAVIPGSFSSVTNFMMAYE
ncbi:fimbrial protein [Rouxiella sp. Mn2063]|uniref:fimbrial protein n=1 Tax=Rouxiella sp. Mn2063 TaxID=3395262 RepID=UPI003BC48AB9